MTSLPRTRVLTGITTTGTPHLGNYVGAIRPTVQASRISQNDGFYFLADYHALIKCDEPARIQRSTMEIAASWIASGLDPDKVTFYRQSDIPEIPELTWLLTCVTGKGLLNRAHAYKAAVDKNNAAGHDPDSDVSAGLLAGYTDMMPLDAATQAALPILLRGACLRFLLTRCYDWINTPADALVTRFNGTPAQLPGLSYANDVLQ